MSNRSSGKFVKSASEGELLDRAEETKLIMGDQDCGECLVSSRPNNSTPRLNVGVEPKLKRTFTLPRNPFASSRMSKRRAKLKDGNKQENGVSQPSEQNIHGTIETNKKKIFRRPSLRKFFSKMVQHVSSVPTKNIRNMDKRRSSARDLSLSSNDIRVPPLKPINFGSDKVPGVIGLRNHGNTCFINAVLQCLSHTDILAEYFVLDQYKADLSRRNKLNSKKYGTKGEVTEQLATLLKSIWSCQYAPEISTQFKEVVDKYGSQYRGAHQHDAQEFLLWLLDKVHEDLNTATKKKYKAIKNSFGRPDDVVAEETLANHKRCNNSFVHALFQAQFRSSLTCPKCHSQSNTFDPFLCVSIPVPQKQKRPLFVTVLYLSQQPREVQLGLSLPLNAEVRELREQLASDTGISEQYMLLTEIDDLAFVRTFADSQSTANMRDTDPLYCIELPQLKEASEESGAYVLLCWVNVLQMEDHCARFGSPYTMQVGRETSYEDLQKLILKEMSSILHDDILVNSQEIPLFRMRIAGMPMDPDYYKSSERGPYLDPTLDHPLYMEAVDQALALCQEDAGPAHLKLVLEWDPQAKGSTIADDSEQVEELASVKQLRSSADEAGAATLEECFELYTRDEVLGPDDAWHCPYCNRKQEVVKKLGLWSLPDILVIHLKRFRQSSKQRSTAKLTTLVDFPLYGFDMSPHLARRARGGNEGGGVPGGLGWSPWKRPRRQTSRHEDNVYDLYAICNHHGQDLQGGHYTACCRNPFDGNWYTFDDTRVEGVAENLLVTPAAYILFYQHRSLSVSTGGSSSCSSSSSEHWVCRMPAFDYAPPPSKSSEEINNKAGSADEAAPPKFQRGSRGYATLQPNTQNNATSPVSGEKDHYSDDEAPLATNRGWTSPEVGRRASSVPREVTETSSPVARVASPEPSPPSTPPSPTLVTESSV